MLSWVLILSFFATPALAKKAKSKDLSYSKYYQKASEDKSLDLKLQKQSDTSSRQPANVREDDPRGLKKDFTKFRF